MALYYFDANVLVKYFVTEPGSAWVRHLIEEQDSTGQPNHTVFIGEITRVEVASALAVIERVGRITRVERDLIYRQFISQLAHRYAIIPLTTSDIELAANLTQQHPLKAYDAVQLAVAQHQASVLSDLGYRLAFVTGDRTLLTAAQAEGLATENPFDHPDPEDTPRYQSG